MLHRIIILVSFDAIKKIRKGLENVEHSVVVQDKRCMIVYTHNHYLSPISLAYNRYFVNTFLRFGVWWKIMHIIWKPTPSACMHIHTFEKKKKMNSKWLRIGYFNTFLCFFSDRANFARKVELAEICWKSCFFFASHFFLCMWRFQMSNSANEDPQSYQAAHRERDGEYEVDVTIDIEW